MAELAGQPRRYARGAVTYGGATWTNVKIRFKGHRSMQPWHRKPAFKLKFDKSPRGRFFGLQALVLNNMVEDPTMMRETLAYRLYRAAGVPAPRTGYVRVFVNDNLFGLYLVLEAVDKTFLTRHGAPGPLYEGEYGCDLYPSDVPGFDHDGGKDEGRAHLAAFAKAASGPAKDLFFGRDAPVETKNVLHYLAVSGFTSDFDGYRNSHNYRIHRDAKSGKWSFIPWGLDRVFKKQLSIYDSGGRLAKRCFTDAVCRLEYVRAMHGVVAAFESLDLVGATRDVQTSIGAAAAKDPRKPSGEDKARTQRKKLRTWLATRVDAVEDEIGCVVDGKEVDRDRDGHGCMDCDDRNASVHPGARERCDGRDWDCSGRPDDAPHCPCPSATVEGVEFLFCAHPMPWTEAVGFCAAQGAELARLDSPRQARKLAEAAEDYAVDDWWIGLNDRVAEGEFRWVDGSPSTFENWDSRDEPDDYQCGEDCAAMEEGEDGRWRDTHCAFAKPFLCRKPNPPAP